MSEKGSLSYTAGTVDGQRAIKTRRVTDYFRKIVAEDSKTLRRNDVDEKRLPAAGSLQIESNRQSQAEHGSAKEPTACAALAADRRPKRRLPESFTEAPKSAQVVAEEGARHLPVLSFRNLGRTIYACTSDEVEAAAAGLRSAVPAIVGWDLEWRATFRAGEPPRRTALMQICHRDAAGRYTCLLLQVFHAGITPAVHAFLTDPAILKAGVSVSADAHKIFRDFGIQVEGTFELMTHPVVEAEPQLSSRTLASLTAHYMSMELLKGGERTSNWETRPLGLDQQLYAATDAFASLRVFEILQSRPQPEMAPRPAQRDAAAFEVLNEDAPVAWCPPLPTLRRIQPAKLAVYRMVEEQGQTIAQVAAERRIQFGTAAVYLAEAIAAGHGYRWPVQGVPSAFTAPVVALAQQMLLDAGTPLEGHSDVTEALQAAGVGLLEFERRLGVGLHWGQLRVLIAHIGRQGLLSRPIRRAQDVAA